MPKPNQLMSSLETKRLESIFSQVPRAQINQLTESFFKTPPLSQIHLVARQIKLLNEVILDLTTIRNPTE
jgi:hypothetical protein